MKLRRTIAASPATAAPSSPARDPPDHEGFPIVGIAASAGGYEAFTQMLRALPSDTGMAFVFIQHLEPGHKSALPELLANVTPMPVTEARHRTRVRPNHVYVIPPNANLGIRNGALLIKKRQQAGARYLPADYFLSALAEDRKSGAIGVILSGTASDGTVGLKAIRAEGGITFAQDTESAKYHGMPSSAIAAGCVDLVRPPDGIGKELALLARHPGLGLASREAGSEGSAANADMAPAGETGIHQILRLLGTAHGVDFASYRAAPIRRRIARRMVLKKIRSLSRYVDYLRQNRSELDLLFRDIVIHSTGFFRVPETFRALRAHGLPSVLAARKPGETIRAWVPGCSTGEEVYSLAICLLEFLGKRASSTPVQIFATDISDEAIERARSGLYPDSIQRDVSPSRLRRFFTRHAGGYRVNQNLRDMCVFARQELTRDPPFSKLDLVCCRNVLTYLEPAAQMRVVAGFHYALVDTGILLLGNAEARAAHPDLFIRTGRTAGIFRRKPGAVRVAPDLREDGHGSTEFATPVRRAAPDFDPLKEADRLVWQRYQHAGLLLNGNLEILHFRGEASPYLAPMSGKASLDVFRMLKDDLRMELRATIQRAMKLGAPARSAAVLTRHNQTIREVTLEVLPVTRPGIKESHFLVLFNESRPPVPAGEGGAGKAQRHVSQADREIARLRRELEAAREYLRGTVEQQEVSTEELQSANEEILSANEELQSTNEELQTAQEELQSRNEELATLNETLEGRNAELAQLTDDLNNVIAGAEIPILIVSEEGRIRRFTPSAGRLLNLMPADLGRPIGHIRPNIDVTDLDAVIGEVSRNLVEVRREVRSKDGRWYSLRVRPYKTVENKVEGVLLALLDVDGLKRSNEALRESDATVRALLESLHGAIIVIDGGGKIVMTNAGVEQMFGYRRDELQGQTLEVLVPGWLRDGGAEHGRRYFAAPQTAAHLAGLRKDGTEFPAEASLSYAQTAGKLLAVAFIRDVSETLRAETALAERDAALRRSQQELRKLTASLLTAQEEEKRRFAAELHDGLNQRLAALALQVGALERQLPDSAAAAREEAGGFRHAVETLSEDVRRLAHELHPSLLEHFGLSAALRSYCEEMSKASNIRIRFRQRTMPEAIPDEIALCLYRVAQEALSNVAAHSGARNASVVLAAVNDAIRLAVSDDGAGFDPEATPPKPALGLISMRERIRAAGGTLTVESRPGGGSRIEASVPLPRRQS